MLSTPQLPEGTGFTQKFEVEEFELRKKIDLACELHPGTIQPFTSGSAVPPAANSWRGSREPTPQDTWKCLG
jgi:hypothetical protein